MATKQSLLIVIARSLVNVVFLTKAIATKQSLSYDVALIKSLLRQQSFTSPQDFSLASQ